jgi:hypothetical protein
MINLGMMKNIGEINKGLQKVQQAKELFDLFSSKQVFVSDGSKKEAIDVAKGLLRKALQHQVVIKNALDEIMDPKTPLEEDLQRLLKQAQQHDSELNNFLEEMGSLIGAEFEVLIDVLEKADLAEKK